MINGFTAMRNVCPWRKLLKIKILLSLSSKHYSRTPSQLAMSKLENLIHFGRRCWKISSTRNTAEKMMKTGYKAMIFKLKAFMVWESGHLQIKLKCMDHDFNCPQFQICKENRFQLLLIFGMDQGEGAPDKRIEELERSKQGIEKNINNLFNELIENDEGDPFSCFFKKMRNQNNEILQLRQSVSQLEKQLQKKGVGQETCRKMYESYSQSQTVTKASIYQNTQKAREFVMQAEQRTLGFNTFLIKCILDLAKYKEFFNEHFGQRDFNEMEINLDTNKILQQAKMVMQDPQRNSLENGEYFKHLGIDEDKLDEDFFSQISKKLKISDRWKQFIGRHNLIKQSLKRINQGLNLQYQEEQIKHEQITKVISLGFDQFFRKSRLYIKSNEQTEKLIKKIPAGFTEFYQKQRQQLSEEKKQMQQQCAQFIEKLHKYFIQSVQKMFKKHNHGPTIYQKTILQKSLKQELKMSIQTNNWNSALQRMKMITDEKMYSLERRIRWNSNNRVIMFSQA